MICSTPIAAQGLRVSFISKAIRPDTLVALWARVVLQLFPHPVRVNARLVLVGDGIKAAKRGKKMPAVKLLHQQSDSNKPAESNSLAKFIVERQDTDKMALFRLAG